MVGRGNLCRAFTGKLVRGRAAVIETSSFAWGHPTALGVGRAPRLFGPLSLPRAANGPGEACVKRGRVPLCPPVRETRDRRTPCWVQQPPSVGPVYNATANVKGPTVRRNHPKDWGSLTPETQATTKTHH